MAGITIEDLIKKTNEQGAEQSPVPNTQQQTQQSQPAPTSGSRSLGDFYKNPTSAQPDSGMNFPSQKPDYTLPVSAYTSAYDSNPQNVAQAQSQFADISYASQDYADNMQSQIVRDYYAYQNDENYSGMLSRTYTNQAYEYLKRKNNNANDTAWSQPKPEDEFFSVYLPKWTKEYEDTKKAEEAIANQQKSWETLAEESALAQTTTNAQREVMQAKNIEHGNWHMMNWWDKAKYLLVPGSNSYTVDDAPQWFVRLAQSVMPTIMSAGAGGMVGGALGGLIGSIAGPVGTAGGAAIGSKIGAAVFGGGTFLQGMTGIEIPVLNDVLETLDLGETLFKKTQGYIGAVASEAIKQMKENPTIGLFQAVGEIMQDPDNRYLWDVSKYSYGVGADMHFDDTVNFIRNVAAKASDTLLGTNFGQRELTEVSRANIGRSGLDVVEEDTRGYNALLNTYTPIYTGLVEAAMAQGLTEKEAKEFANQNMEEYIYSYMGTSGMMNDFVVGSIADPANFIPFAQGKIAETIGKYTGDADLKAAGKNAQGNLAIDALPPGIQQLAEMVTGKHGSQGIDSILGDYGNRLGIRDVSTLSAVQKYIAGIDDSGKFAGMTEANSHTGNFLKDWRSNLLKKTDETKMYQLSELTTEFVGSLLFEGDIKFEDVPDIVAQITGKMEITDNSPVKKFENSAVMNTLREGLQNAPDRVVNSISEDIFKYRQFATNRAVVDTVAEQLHMTPKQIFDAMDNRKNGADIPEAAKKNKGQKADDSQRQALFKKIRDMKITYTDADGRVMDSEAVIRSIDKFRGHRQQYSQTFMKANIMEKLGQAVDEYNLKLFNIEPDRWWIRLSDLTKSMQSIALLNFSSSYMVNNFLNNMLTRSVIGVGGIDTDAIQTFNKERGLFFSRGEDVVGNYEQTHQTINRNKKASDFLAKFDDLYKKATDNHVLKGVNNIDIEGMETRAASDIGMKRYWDSTWEYNIPDFPPEWDALGLTDTQKAQIRDLALDSPNLEVFTKRAMGEVIVPHADSVINHTLENFYEGDAKTNMADMVGKMTWISRMLDDALQTNDAEKYKAMMNRLREQLTSDINMKNVIQQESSFASDRVDFASAGTAAVPAAVDGIIDMFDDLWIKQTKQNGSLFLDRVVKHLSDEEFDARFEAQIKMQDGDYNIVRGYAVKRLAAMCEGLGLNDATTVQIMENVMKRFEVASEQVKANHEVYQQYGKKSGNGNWDYKYYRQSRIDMLKKSQDIQLQADIDLNNILIRHLRGTLDPSMEGHIDRLEAQYKDIIEAKRKLNAQEIKDLTKRIDADNNYQREQISLRQERARLKQKQNIRNMQDTASLLFKGLVGPVESANPMDISPMTLDSTLNLMLNIDEARIGSKRSAEFLRHYSDKSKAQTVFEPVDYRNSEVNMSFRDYAKTITPEPADQALLQARYNTGDAVPLGAADTKHGTYTEVADKYTPLKPNAEGIKNAEFTQVKCVPMATSNGIAEAGVYYNGEHIGYIVEGMPETVTAKGNTFPVVGLSKDSPNTWIVMVNDKIMEVTPGVPKNAEFTIYAEQGFHPGQPGATPVIQPWGEAALESSMPMREFLDLVEQQGIEDLQKARTNGSLLGKMNPEQREAVLSYVNHDLRPAYSIQRYQTQKYGDMMVDMSLLNYSNRYGFDNMLTMLMPYQFWMTRSVANWSKRMISQPKWFSMMARIEKLVEKNKKDVLPSRLEGLVGLPMPNMGDGLGSALYIDPVNIMLPFQQFYHIPDYYTGNIRTIHNNTLTVIDDYYNSGKPYKGHIITDDEYNEAMEAKGDLYNEIFKEQQKLDETDTSFSGLMTTFMQPSVLVDAIMKKMKGKDAGISMSPAYRLGNTIKATGENTFMEPVTNAIGGAMQLPDKAFRKALNIETNPEGNYFDYYMTNLITDMYIMREISYDDMTRAMVEGPGNDVYDKALYRYHQQQAIRNQGGALMTEIGQGVIGGNKETSAGQLLQSAIASVFGAKTMSSGEEVYREMKNTKDVIRESGDKELASQFYKDFPEYSIHNWSYEDDPDERIHKMMVSKVWAVYNALPSTQQRAVSKGLGDRFNQLFLSPDTRATDYLSDEELGNWIRAMEGNDPTFTDDQINDPGRQAAEIRWYADSVQSQADTFDEVFKRRFPGFDEVEKGYYIVPVSMREKYKQDNPMLQKGWDFRNAAYMANPELAVYKNDSSATYKVSQGQYDDITAALYGNLSSWVKGQVEDYLKYGFAMKPDAEHTLKKTYASLGVNVPYEEWLKNVSK